MLAFKGRETVSLNSWNINSPVLYLLAVLFACPVLAQSSSQTAEAVQTPRPALGLSYEPAQMIKRLVQLAEGPIPPRTELEIEFGFEFQLRSVDKDGYVYWAQASHPFGQGRPRNLSYYEFLNRQAITLNYVASSEYCISTLELLKEMQGKWTRRVLPHGHFPTRVVYVATFAGVERQLELDPNDLHGGSCLKLFSIDYGAKEGDAGK
jgi:hypothetical protein